MIKCMKVGGDQVNFKYEVYEVGVMVWCIVTSNIGSRNVPLERWADGNNKL